MASITFKDKTVDLKPLPLAKLQVHAKYLKDETMAEIKRHMQGLPLALCQYAWDRARTEIAELEIGSAKYKQACFTVAGVAHALWLAVAPELKDFTLENAIELIEADFSLCLEVTEHVLGFPSLK